MTKDEVFTKDRILQTAFSLFLHRGYENTPIQAIIDTVDIAKGTFYHHFRSKEDLLLALVEGLISRIHVRAREILEEPGQNARDKMRRLFEDATAIKLEKWDESVILARQLRAGGNERMQHRLKGVYERVMGPVFTALISEGKEEGLFRVENPGGTAHVIMAITFGIQDEAVELFLDAWDGDEGALDRLVVLFDAWEQALGRILGLADGTLPVYDADSFRKLMLERRNQGAVK